MTTQLLINARSGLLTGLADPDQITSRLDKLTHRPTVTIAESPAQLDAFVKSVVANPPDQLYIAGGDGTTATIMKALQATSVCFGLIPTGSLNNIGRTLGIPSDIDAAIDIINAGHIERMDAGEVNGQVFLESVGIGLLANIMDRVGEQDTKKEVFKVAATTISELANVESLPVHIEADERVIDAQTVWLTVTNTGRAAAALVDPSSNVHDGRLELVYCEPLSPTELAKYVISYLNNSHIEEPKFHRLRSARIKIRLPSVTSVHIDGIVTSADHLTITTLAKTFGVIAP